MKKAVWIVRVDFSATNPMGNEVEVTELIETQVNLAIQDKIKNGLLNETIIVKKEYSSNTYVKIEGVSVIKPKLSK